MQVLEDVIAPDLRVLFCGTAAGAESARRKAYYAGPGNKFWPTLQQIGLTPRLFAPEEFRALLALRIGLTDLCKHASGADSALRAGDFDRTRLLELIGDTKPRAVAFTSKKAGEFFLGGKRGYGLQPDHIGRTAVHILPSPSGAACGSWSIAPWRRLARAISADASATPN